MALTYKDQATLVADTVWQGRVAACAADVAQATIQTLPNTAPNEFQLKGLAVRAVTDTSLTVAFCRLVAAGFGAPVTALATPVADTGTDAQIRTQVRNAFDALVSR